MFKQMPFAEFATFFKSKYFVTVLLNLILISVGVEAKEFSFAKQDSESVQKISVVDWGSLKVSKACFEQQQACAAQLAKMSRDNPPTTGPLVVDPSVLFCENNGGKLYIFKDEKSNQSSFCRIGKDFYIDTWSLYYSRIEEAK